MVDASLLRKGARDRLVRNGTLHMAADRAQLKRVEKAVHRIVEAGLLNKRFMPSLIAHVAAETFDWRTAHLRRLMGKRRNTICMARQRMWERRDADPELDKKITELIDELRNSLV